MAWAEPQASQPFHVLAWLPEFLANFYMHEKRQWGHGQCLIGGRGARLALGILLLVAALPAALACGAGAQRLRLTRPVELSPAELAEFRAMAPLRVLSAEAPPMVRYDGDRGAYAGLGVDVLCFISQRLGLRYEILQRQDLSAVEKIRQVQEGRADVYMPLSASTERAERGLFTRPFHEGHYAVIARKGWRPELRSTADLAPFRVGVIRGAAFETLLKEVVAGERLMVFDEAASDRLFQALRSGTIDAAVFSKSLFDEMRYLHEYFDLEVAHVLHDAPRAYGFYFAPSARNQQVVQAFDRFLVALDVSGALAADAGGERQFIERYVAQRKQQTYWKVAAGVAVVLVLVLFLALSRYHRLVQRLAHSNEQILRQQQALEAANQELEKLSQTDGLTGLANRRQFDRALLREHARQQRTGEPLSLLMTDLDHFKHVNDHYGHAIGDDYLRAVARVLQTSVNRATDLAARYGGEEFVCLLPDTSAEDALLLAERIRQGVTSLGLPNALADSRHLTVSVGAATLAGGACSAAQLLSQADEQLYAAKHAGRDRVHGVVLRG